MGELVYESATIAYNTATGNYVNPQDGTIYGPQPPIGGWPIVAYQDVPGINIQVTPSPSTTAQTAASISDQLVAAGSITNTTGVAVTSVISTNTLLLIAGVGMIMFMMMGRK